MPIVSRVATRMARRPSRSPKCPARKAPSGRNTKLMPTVAKDSTSPIEEPAGAKNSSENTKPAAVP
ncbi:Uncharacterised protein [Mycobacteroides abscessus subsp. abscessus]|nr:Uncharacterised protein [Mycobacteroides abscessus subsp. abscessus]